jgi:hypothetical protein
MNGTEMTGDMTSIREHKNRVFVHAEATNDFSGDALEL